MGEHNGLAVKGTGQSGLSLPPHFRHNFIALLVDYVFFGVAFSFINPSTVLPAFVRTLTDSEPLVGLIGTVMNGGWLLPQLGAAAIMSGRPRKKPYLLTAIYLGRPLYFLLAFAVWMGLVRYSGAMLVIFFLCIGLFTASDSIASVAWFDIIARAVPLVRRGRLIGAGQVLSSMLGIGVGVLVGLILDSPSISYPTDYAMLFALAALAFLPSTIALSLLREPEGSGGEVQRSRLGFPGRLGQVWRDNPNFRRLVGHRWLTGLISLSLSFYVLHATEVVGLPEATTGWFVSAQMAGGILSSAALGWLSERKGPRAVIRWGSSAILAIPLLALVIHFSSGGWLAWLYPVVYFAIGTMNSSGMLGSFNYLLEIAPDEQRPLYVGLSNTLQGLLVPASLVGGLLLRVTSYPVLFALTAAGVTAGVLLGFRLEEPPLRGGA